MCDQCDKYRAEIDALESRVEELVEQNECLSCRGYKFKNLKERCQAG